MKSPSTAGAGTPAKKIAGAGSRLSTAPACSSQNDAETSGPTVSLQGAMAALAKTMEKAAELAGVSVAEFQKLPKSEQNDFMAQARGSVRPEAQVGGMRQVPVRSIGPSPFNREIFDLEELKEFADGIKDKGIIQPLVVRKNPGYQVMKGEAGKFHVATNEGTPASELMPIGEATKLAGELNEPEFELIAGERRWRGAKIAKLAEVPILVREANDQEALELQFIENEDREAVNPLDEARKFSQLRDLYIRHGASKTAALDKLKALTSRSEGGLYQRMSLLNLPPTAQQLIAQGRLPASHAELLTKLKNPGVAGEIADKIANERGCEPIPFRQAKELVDEAVKNEANLADWQRKADDFVKRGLRVLSVRECETWLQGPKQGDHWWIVRGTHKPPFIKGDEYCELDSQYRHYEKLWNKAPPEILGRLPNGRAVIVYDRQAAEAAVRAGGKLRTSSSSQSTSEREREQELKRKRVVFDRAVGSMMTSVESQPMPSHHFWHTLLPILIRCSWSDTVKRVARRRRLDIKNKSAVDVLAKHVLDLGEQKCRALFAEIVMTRRVPGPYDNDWDDDLVAACKLYRIDLKAMERELR